MKTCCLLPKQVTGLRISGNNNRNDCRQPSWAGRRPVDIRRRAPDAGSCTPRSPGRCCSRPGLYDNCREIRRRWHRTLRHFAVVDRFPAGGPPADQWSIFRVHENLDHRCRDDSAPDRTVSSRREAARTPLRRYVQPAGTVSDAYCFVTQVSARPSCCLIASARTVAALRVSKPARRTR